MISFTGRGDELNALLRDRFRQARPQCVVTAYSKCSKQTDSSLLTVTEDLKDWTGARFADSDAILFIGATGIAVRAISPFVASKAKDPAILVVGDRGQYMISLLSGHLGGANELAIELAGYIDALPVITTATDNHRKFAVDIFAKDNGLLIEDMTLAKYVSVEVLHEHRVELFTDMEIAGDIPAEIRLRPLEEEVVAEEIKDETARSEMVKAETVKAETAQAEERLYMVVSDRWLPNRSAKTLQLIPRDLVIGIGCRRGTLKEDIELAVFDSLQVLGLRPEAVGQIVSIDLKADERGLLHLTAEHQWPFQTYSAEQLLAAKGEFHSSEFVRQTTGVDNVCERSVAVALADGGGEILREKAVYQGVTICVGRRKQILQMRKVEE